MNSVLDIGIAADGIRYTLTNGEHVIMDITVNQEEPEKTFKVMKKLMMTVAPRVHVNMSEDY